MLRPNPVAAGRDAIAFPFGAISAAIKQRGALSKVDHRPWPPPDRPWLMGQTWRDLLFAHWPVHPDELARVVPKQLPLDVRDDAAWIGVTPFQVDGLSLRFVPPAPFVSRFLEVNVRTYVTIGDRPGIYFLSLDAASNLAVRAARRAYRLPYFHAEASLDNRGEPMRFQSTRVSDDGPPAELDCAYGPQGEPSYAEEGTLEHFLTERYCLYTLDETGRIHRGEIHHRPWPLQPASGELPLNTMATALGLALDGEPLLHFSERQDVVLWSIEPV
jgi:uncharacterized protein YqjF (DUF2071 family)